MLFHSNSEADSHRLASTLSRLTTQSTQCQHALMLAYPTAALHVTMFLVLQCACALTNSNSHPSCHNVPVSEMCAMRNLSLPPHHHISGECAEQRCWKVDMDWNVRHCQQVIQERVRYGTDARHDCGVEGSCTPNEAWVNVCDSFGLANDSMRRPLLMSNWL